MSRVERGVSDALSKLIQEQRVRLLGANRQELLSGIREHSLFQRIRDYLRDFPNVDLDAVDYEEAARISNACRSVGIASSPVDMLLCSVALRHDWEIFTTDRDFIHYARVVPLQIFTA